MQQHGNSTRSSIQVIDAECHTCRRCLARQVCKTKALVRLDPDDAPYLDIHRCMGCQLCVTECPYGAIRPR